MRKSIVFTGGGSAGHVTPNLALMSLMQDWDIAYIGSHGIEKTLLKDSPYPFYEISSGKLRRYFSFRHLSDPFKVLWAIVQSFFILGRLKPNVVFSKGGFVAFPVVFAAFLRRIPVLAHESDLSPGLANRLSFPFCQKICVTFPEALSRFPKGKAVFTGTPIRDFLLKGDAARAKAALGFDDKPVILIMAGGSGSIKINQLIRDNLDVILSKYQIIHLCGANQTDLKIAHKGYCQIEYAKENLADYFALAGLVISRAGANTLYELLALKKPHILIPLSKAASRGDQIENAALFESKGYSTVIAEENCVFETVWSAINRVYETQADIIERLSTKILPDANAEMVHLLDAAIAAP